MTWAILWQNLARLWHTRALDSGNLWHSLAYFAILWHTLAYPGIISASLITTDGAYHCPVGSIMAIFITQSGCTSPISAIPEPPILVKLKGNQATFASIGSISNLKGIAHKLNVVIFNDLTLSTSSCPKKRAQQCY